MELNINQIDEVDGLDVEHLYAEGEPDLEDENGKIVRRPILRLHASRDGDEVLLRGDIKATVQFECDRCLIAFDQSVNQHFDLVYLPVNDSRKAHEEHELTEDDLSISYYQGHMINLDDLTREQIALTLPMRRLCREDCLGLCQYCRANLNDGQCNCSGEEQDSRWNTLRELKLN